MTLPDLPLGDATSPTPDGSERVALTRQALARAKLDAIVCTLPTNVLMLSGYWPVVGTACAIAWSNGRVLLIIPDDEQALATRTWADEVRVMTSTDSDDPMAMLSAELARAASEWGGARIGVEGGPAIQPASYVAMCVYGPRLWDVVVALWPHTSVIAADDVLAGLRARMTAVEVSAVAMSCGVAAYAFATAADVLRPRLRETHIAAAVRAPLETGGPGDNQRAQGFAFCMSGPNAANAYRAYARSSARRIERGDLILIHCNSCIDGYWTDITRTYCLGEPDTRQRAMYDAVFEARNAALGAIRPGVAARSVDQAARAVLTARGFGTAFKHALGHGVGFAAIDHSARPRLAPASDDVLEPNMVCNIEPAIYLDGYGGIRHCDVVAVTEDGGRVLTPFQISAEALAVDIAASI